MDTSHTLSTATPSFLLNAKSFVPCSTPSPTEDLLLYYGCPPFTIIAHRSDGTLRNKPLSLSSAENPWRTSRAHQRNLWQSHAPHTTLNTNKWGRKDDPPLEKDDILLLQNQKFYLCWIVEVAFSKYGRRKPDALALVGICMKDGTRVEECLFGHGGRRL